MEENQIIQLIEEIIGMPSPELADEYARANASILIEPEFKKVLAQSLNQEMRSQGWSEHLSALNALISYVDELQNRSLSASEVCNTDLPQLLVLPQQKDGYDDDGYDDYNSVADEEAAVAPDSFNQWLDILHNVNKYTAPEPEVPAEKALDDLGKMNLNTNIDDRILGMTLKITQHPAQLDESDIDELNSIISDCNRLLNAPETKYGSYIPEHTMKKRASAIKGIADVYDALGDAQSAKEYYSTAANEYRAAGDTLEANRCLVSHAWVEFTHEGNFDAALAQLRGILQSVPSDTLEHTEHLVNIGKLYFNADEDYEAERILKQALVDLDKSDYANPSGAKLADALTQTMMSVFSGEEKNTAEQPIVVQNEVRSLYNAVYIMLQQIADQAGDEAAANDYLRRQQALIGRERDGNASNREFSERMMQSLGKIFEEYDKNVNSK